MRLYKVSDFYNPHYIRVGNEVRVVKKIVIFNDSGVVHQINWFMDKECRNSVPIDIDGVEAIRKAKEEFVKTYERGIAYWIPKKKESYESNREKHCILYIPYNLLGISEVGRKPQTLPQGHKTWDRVEYSILDGQGYFTESENERQTDENKKNEKISKLIGMSPFKHLEYEITSNFDELKKLVDTIDSIKRRK